MHVTNYGHCMYRIILTVNSAFGQLTLNLAVWDYPNDLEGDMLSIRLYLRISEYIKQVKIRWCELKRKSMVWVAKLTWGLIELFNTLLIVGSVYKCTGNRIAKLAIDTKILFTTQFYKGIQFSCKYIQTCIPEHLERQHIYYACAFRPL